MTDGASTDDVPGDEGKMTARTMSLSPLVLWEAMGGEISDATTSKLLTAPLNCSDGEARFMGPSGGRGGREMTVLVANGLEMTGKETLKVGGATGYRNEEAV